MDIGLIIALAIIIGLLAVFLIVSFVMVSLRILMMSRRIISLMAAFEVIGIGLILTAILVVHFNGSQIGVDSAIDSILFIGLIVAIPATVYFLCFCVYKYLIDINEDIIDQPIIKVRKTKQIQEKNPKLEFVPEPLKESTVKEYDNWFKKQKSHIPEYVGIVVMEEEQKPIKTEPVHIPPPQPKQPAQIPETKLQPPEPEKTSKPEIPEVVNLPDGVVSMEEIEQFFDDMNRPGEIEGELPTKKEPPITETSLETDKAFDEILENSYRFIELGKEVSDSENIESLEDLINNWTLASMMESNDPPTSKASS